MIEHGYYESCSSGLRARHKYVRRRWDVLESLFSKGQFRARFDSPQLSHCLCDFDFPLFSLCMNRRFVVGLRFTDFSTYEDLPRTHRLRLGEGQDPRERNPRNSNCKGLLGWPLACSGFVPPLIGQCLRAFTSSGDLRDPCGEKRMSASKPENPRSHCASPSPSPSPSSADGTILAVNAQYQPGQPAVTPKL